MNKNYLSAAIAILAVLAIGIFAVYFPGCYSSKNRNGARTVYDMNFIASFIRHELLDGRSYVRNRNIVEEVYRDMKASGKLLGHPVWERERMLCDNNRNAFYIVIDDDGHHEEIIICSSGIDKLMETENDNLCKEYETFNNAKTIE